VLVEEVTLKGGLERQPDLALYVNGIAVGVIELKRSTLSVGDGIRQLLSKQQPEFNAGFFSTVQFVFAGNNTEGLRYGTIGTPEKMFLQWKEDEADNSRYKLDKYLLKLCEKRRLLELMHDFVLFDGGVKKLPRVHQFFGLKATQEFVKHAFLKDLKEQPSATVGEVFIATKYGTYIPNPKPGEDGDMVRGTFLIGRNGCILWANRGDEPFIENRTLLVELARAERPVTGGK